MGRSFFIHVSIIPLLKIKGIASLTMDIVTGIVHGVPVECFSYLKCWSGIWRMVACTSWVVV